MWNSIVGFFQNAGHAIADFWVNSALPFFYSIGNWFIDAYNFVSASISDLMAKSVFWYYAIPAAATILVLIILISIIQKLRRHYKRSRLIKNKQKHQKSIAEQKKEMERDDVFVPEPLADIDENPLLQKLLCAEDWNEELYELCRTEGPSFIFTLASAWLRIPPQIMQGLAELALNEKWVKQYIARMDNFRYTPDYAMLLWDLAPDPDCLPLLADLLGAKEPRVQLAAVDLIGKIRDNRMIPYLIGNLLRPEQFVTARVGEALVAMGPEAARICADMIPRNENKEVLLLLEVLSLFNCDYPIQNVLDCLNSPLEQVRARAAKTLGESRRQKAADRLIIALKDESAQVRSATVTALGELDAKSAANAVEPLVKDENWAVRVNAQKVLEKLKKK